MENPNANTNGAKWIVVGIATAIAFVYGFGIGIDLYESTSDSPPSDQTGQLHKSTTNAT